MLTYEQIVKLLAPLVIAFIGAYVGSYFGIKRSKKERLWKEKFEALQQILTSSEIIQAQHEVLQMEELGVSAIPKFEFEALNEKLIFAKSNLRESLSKLKLLFPKSDLDDIQKAYVSLNESIMDLLNISPADYSADFLWTVHKSAEVLGNEAINLAQRKCL